MEFLPTKIETQTKDISFLNRGRMIEISSSEEKSVAAFPIARTISPSGKQA